MACTDHEPCPVCGHLVADAELAVAYHQRQGQPQDLSHLSGANDVDPLPERTTR